MTIVENIWKIRESKKISRREMAEHLCISQDTYKDIEYGKIRLSLENYLLICEKLELSPMELLTKNNNEHFILLSDKDLNDLNRIIEKINNQTNNFNNCTGNFNIINNREK